MSLFTILDTILIGPLKLAFEIIFAIAIKFIGSPGLTIIVFSLVMNILVLPLYRRADAMQEHARDVEAKLRDGVSHIKKTFSGDERMMILQTYYRQNDYRPTDALNGSVSLLLEIPFFMAAYQFLTHLDALNGASLGPISNLGQPDALLVIGSVTLNLLPILMTLINVVSSAIYLKGFPLKTKVQLYGMALFFLVFLYNSPAGLVFYWTLNNLFSLVKTIFYKLKHPGRVLVILASAAGLVLPILAWSFFDIGSTIRKIFILGMVLLLQLPLVYAILKARLPGLFKAPSVEPDRKMFLLGSLFLTVLAGLLIPSNFIAASPQEFVDPTLFHHPLWYVLSSLCLSAGFFLLWLRVFYSLASDTAKVFFERVVWVLCGLMLVNYMFFGTKLGIISSSLHYERGVWFSAEAQLKNLAILLLIALMMYFFAVKWRRGAAAILLTAVIALGGMSIINVATISRSIGELDQTAQEKTLPSFRLSKDGKNVVVIMLDRMLGEFVPYMLKEKPELEEKFDGFTYYDNTISYGGATNYGSPPLYGGYEYTPVEMNKRDDEWLKDKHNEALKVLPVLFSENEYDVTVFDPVYANYNWIPDLSIFDEYPEINVQNTRGKFTDDVQKQMVVENNHRNFFVFSTMKCMPLFLQRTIYNEGNYLRVANYSEGGQAYLLQVVSGTSQSTGISGITMSAYNVLDNMDTMTEITEDGGNTFLIMSSDMPHEPMLLKAPEYVPDWNVDNRAYDEANKDRFTVDGRTLNIQDKTQMTHYHIDMAAMLLMADWFDYLRENDVYDNTRIILVADHGNSLGAMEELMHGGSKSLVRDAERFFPLLMVKDFDSSGFITSHEFMTNADVPTLAVADLIEEPVNPFTGKEINSDEKTAHEQFINMSWVYDVSIVNGKTYIPSLYASVKDDIWVADNWTFYDGEIIPTEHKVP